MPPGYQEKNAIVALLPKNIIDSFFGVINYRRYAMKKYKYTSTVTYEGKRYFVRGDTKKELYENRARKLMELEQDIKIYSPSTTVKDWAEEAYRTYKADIAETSLEGMQYRLKKYILPDIGAIPVSKVKPIQCQNILNSVKDQSTSQISKLYQELHFIFASALKNELIRSDPTDGLTIPRGTKGTRQALTPYEAKIFLQVANSRPKYKLFLLMYYCGCRPEEAIEAQGRDISVKDGIKVLHIRGTKTANADRYVPVPDALSSTIAGTGAFEFISPNNSEHRHTKSSYVRLVASLKRDMNIAMGCRTYRNALLPPYPLRSSFVPYDLRHTYCTNLAKAGVDIRVAQKLMGHASISITSRIYTHIDDDFAIRDAAGKIGCTEKSTRDREIS